MAPKPLCQKGAGSLPLGPLWKIYSMFLCGSGVHTWTSYRGQTDRHVEYPALGQKSASFGDCKLDINPLLSIIKNIPSVAFYVQSSEAPSLDQSNLPGPPSIFFQRLIVLR